MRPIRRWAIPERFRVRGETKPILTGGPCVTVILAVLHAQKLTKWFDTASLHRDSPVQAPISGSGWFGTTIQRGGRQGPEAYR